MRPSASSAASPLAIWAGILVLYVVWGSTYLGIKVAVETIPPFAMGFMRFVAAGLLLAGAVAIRSRHTIRRPSLVAARDTAIVGGFLLLGGMGLVAWAELTVPSGIAALLIALMPMWLAIFGRVLLGDRLPLLASAGIALGLVGVAILAWPAGEVGDLDPAGLAALIASPIFWSLGSLYAARRAVLPAPALFASGLEMVAGGLLLLLAAALSGELATFDVTAVSAASWAGLLYLLVVGSLVGYTTYTWLLGVAPLPRLSTYAYVNPVVAVILGALILGEPITPRTVVAAAVIVVAVVLIVTARGRVGSTATDVQQPDLEAALPDAVRAELPAA
jgi:drug/metabolite transporter (DMT)-like permease